MILSLIHNNQMRSREDTPGLYVCNIGATLQRKSPVFNIINLWKRAAEPRNLKIRLNGCTIRHCYMYLSGRKLMWNLWKERILKRNIDWLKIYVSRYDYCPFYTKRDCSWRCILYHSDEFDDFKGKHGGELHLPISDLEWIPDHYYVSDVMRTIWFLQRKGQVIPMKVRIGYSIKRKVLMSI